MLEIQKSIEEETLLSKDDYLNYGMLSRHTDPGRERLHKSCNQCGYQMSEGEKVCEQCGYSVYEAEEIKKEAELNEGGCGCPSTCGGCNTCDDEYETGAYQVLDYDSDNDFIPDHMHFEYQEDVMQPGEAFGAGYKIGKHDSDVKIGNHKNYKGSYMAKSHLYKVNKYAEKLYQMIPDGHNLEDWMRTKLAQIADDIGEVYHALDHDHFEGDI